MTLAAPEPLAEHHLIDAFECGNESLELWLTRRALKNQAQGSSRTFVICEGQRVVAYYALASGAIASREATGRLRRNMPDPVPVALLARLAVNLQWQRHGLGRMLMRDAGLRVLQAAGSIGIRGMIVKALTADAKAFYEALGFETSPIDEMLLMITLADLEASV